MPPITAGWAISFGSTAGELAAFRERPFSCREPSFMVPQAAERQTGRDDDHTRPVHRAAGSTVRASMCLALAVPPSRMNYLCSGSVRRVQPEQRADSASRASAGQAPTARYPAKQSALGAHNTHSITPGRSLMPPACSGAPWRHGRRAQCRRYGRIPLVTLALCDLCILDNRHCPAHSPLVQARPNCTRCRRCPTPRSFSTSERCPLAGRRRALWLPDERRRARTGRAKGSP